MTTQPSGKEQMATNEANVRAYEELKTADDVHRAFAAGRRVQYFNPRASVEWEPAHEMPTAADYQGSIAHGVRFRAATQPPPTAAKGWGAAVADARAWSLIELAQVNGAIADEGEDGKFWTLGLAAWKSLDEALEAIYLPERRAALSATQPNPEGGELDRARADLKQLMGEFRRSFEATFSDEAIAKRLANPEASTPTAMTDEEIIARCDAEMGVAGNDQAEIKRLRALLIATEGGTANLCFMATNLREEGHESRAEMVEAADRFIDNQKALIDLLLATASTPTSARGLDDLICRQALIAIERTGLDDRGERRYSGDNFARCVEIAKDALDRDTAARAAATPVVAHGEAEEVTDAECHRAMKSLFPYGYNAETWTGYVRRTLAQFAKSRALASQPAEGQKADADELLRRVVAEWIADDKVAPNTIARINAYLANQPARDEEAP